MRLTGSRKERIREQMMDTFLHGGKRVFISWLLKWYKMGDGWTSGVIRWVGTIIFGAQSLASGNIFSVIAFYLAYIPAITIVGFMYYWMDFVGAENMTGMIVDPFAYQVRAKLKIKDSDSL